MRVLRYALTLAIVLGGFAAQANHILGGNITYTCLGGNDYGITLTIYKDCFGATPAPAQENVFFIPDGCALPFSVNLALQSVEDVSDLCDTEIANNSCNGGFIPGTELLTYYAEVTLDPGCFWDISWASGDWNYFNNMDNGMLPTAYIDTVLDPTNVPCANSVVPQLEFPVTYACAGDPVTYQLDLLNPDGYDLDLTIVCPQTVGGADAPLITPCDEPIAGLTFDDVTGTFSFNAPMMFGSYAAAVQIDMFDNGNYVGTVYESIAFIVRACSATPTLFALPEIQDLNDAVTQVSDNEIDACVGDSLCVSVEASNANIFRSIALSSDFETLFPGGTLTQTGLNPATAELCVALDESMIGTTTVTIDAEDDACINPSTDQIQLIINVNPSLSLSVADTLACAGVPVEVTASGDTQFQWTPVTGDLTPVAGNGAVQNLSPAVTTEYEVTALNANAACNVLDTLTVQVALSAVNGVVTDESCAGNDGAIDLTPSGAGGPYAFDWPALGSNTEDQTGLTGGDYTVTVTDLSLPGCSVDTTMTVDTTPPPTGSITGDATICEGECTDITFAFTGTGPFTVELLNETTGALEATAALNDGDVFEVCPNQTTTYTLQLVTDGNAPACTYTVPSSVTVTVRPIPTATFLAANAICAGEGVDLEIDIDQPGTFEVEYTPNDGTPASPALLTDGDLVNVSPDATTTYEITSVAYTDAPACAYTAVQSTTVTVNDLPTAVLSGDQTICEGDAVALTIELTGTGPWEVTHDYAAEASPIAINASPFTWDLGTSPATSTVIALTGVTDLGTGCTNTANTTADIVVNPLPSAVLQDDATVCSDESIDLTFVLQSNGPYDVTWSDGTNTFTANGIADGHIETVDPTGTTQYCITEITDVNGCVSQPNSCVTISETPLASAAFAANNDAICAGECYDIAFNFADGTGPYELTFEETDNTGTITTTVTLADGDVYQVCPAGDYNATLTGAIDTGTGCNMDISAGNVFDLTVTPIATVDAAGDATICNGDCTELEFTFSNAVGPVNIDIDGVPINGLDLVADMTDSTYFFEVCPAITTTYTLSAFSDDNNGCTNILNDQVTVTVLPLPEASFASDLVICEGESTDLVWQVTGGPIDAEISIDDGTTVVTDNLIGVNDGDLFTVTPPTTTTYTITSITDNGVPVTCTNAPNEVAEVTVNGSPQVILTDTLCTNTAESFQFFIEFSGGDPGSYSVDIPGTIVTNNGGLTYEYTSDPLVPEDGHTFTLTDANDCDPTTITLDPFSCPILTFAGTMDVTPQILCDNEVLSATQNGDEVLDPNDVLSYIIHSNAGEQLGVVYYISDTPVWDIAADLDLPGTLQYGVEYYVSAVAGDDDGSGVVDLGADGIDIAAGTPFTIVEPPAATLSGDATLCAGETTDLTVDFTGSGPFTFSYALDGAEAPDSPVGPVTDNPFVFTVDAAGQYTLLSVSNDGCDGAVNSTADVIVNPLPTATIDAGGSFCEGESLDLGITLTGAANWDVTFANDQDSDGTVDFTETVTLTAANSIYTVADSTVWFVDEVSDANGCVNTDDSTPVEVDITELPTAAFAFGDTTFCAGASIDVLIDLTGNGPWTIDYSIDGAPFQSVSNDAQAVLTTNLAGAFCIDQVTDANGCVITPGDCIQIDEIAIPVADAGQDLVLCSGGSVQIGTPGDPALTYTWTPEDNLSDAGVAQPTVTAESTTDAPEVLTYTLTVNDGACSATDEVVVTLQPLPQAEAGEEGFVCFEGTLQLQASGGDTYLWEDNGSFTAGGLDTPDPIVEPATSDWYVVAVSDVNGCTAEDSVFVNVGTPLAVVEDAPASVCFETCDGVISLTTSGSFAPYIYDWGPAFADTSMIEDLCAGTYDYVITDSIGCTLTGSITLNELPAYFLDDVILTQPTCFGQENGIIDAESASADTFTLEATNETNTLGIFNNLGAGDYLITATDAFGCTADTTVTLTSVSAAITLDVSIDEQIYCVGDPVTFEATAGGGDGNFAYTWYGDVPPAAQLSTDNPYNFTMADSLTAYVVALDGNGCASDTLTSTAFLNDPITVSVGPEDSYEICEGECLDFTSETGGGTGQLELDWVLDQTGDTLSTGANLSTCPPPLNQVQYILFASDGCTPTASDTIDVFIYEVPNVTISMSDSTGCFPVTVTLINETDESFFGLCEWDMGDGTILPSCADVTYTYAIPGEYTPTLTVTSEFGCVGTAETPATIEVYDYPEADFNWTPQPVTTIENEVDFVNLSSPDAVEFAWDFGGLGTSIEENPSTTVPPVDLSSFEICLEVENVFGCADTTCYFLDVGSETLIYVPNVFTPDNDGLNEVFVPVIGGGIDPTEYRFRIWNRWGDIVFDSTIVGEGWNGSYGRGEYYVQNDVYVWEVQYKDLDSGESEVLTGHVTILR